MTADEGRDLQFDIVLSRPAQKSVRTMRDPKLKARVFRSLRNLAEGPRTWGWLGATKIRIADKARSLRSFRTDGSLRLIWEGPFQSKRFTRPVLFVHDICPHDAYERKLRHLAGVDPDSFTFEEFDLVPDDLLEPARPLSSEQVAFSKPLPAAALLNPEVIEQILTSPKAGIHLTLRQLEAVEVKPPLLVHGHAGSGKTTVLCHRLALAILSRRKTGSPARIAFLSYNDRLVEQAEVDLREILRVTHSESDEKTGVDFVPFQDFLRGYVPNPSYFARESYVPFGRFKRYYEVYRRGDPATRKIPAEVAWHAIRSILKGACLPPLRPPLSKESYFDLARRRREFPEDTFDTLYRIGLWYQREVIQAEGLWDDQDLASAALEWVLREKERNPSMELYDMILCDEVQDLTEMEFRLLTELCRPPPSGEEGLGLAVSGDPLQTINPTGFRWSVATSEVFRVQGRPVRMHELQENFRSDKRIVKLANQVQRIRSHYLKQRLEDQEAFELDGEIPQVIVAETDDEVSFLRGKLEELPPETAVIVWPDDDEALSQIRETEEVLKRIDPKLDLYTVSEAKGLEFRFVVLYRLGSSPEAERFNKYVRELTEPPLADEIPLLYFLNRLYVAITRARSFLLVIDTKRGVDEFWSKWKETMHFIPRAELRPVLDKNPAFLGEVTAAHWRDWADKLLDHAERTGDTRLHERARRAYEKAGETQRMKWVDARMMEINEDWEPAGKLYFEIRDFHRSTDCYERAGKWPEAYEACSRLPTTPKTKRRLEILRFRRDLGVDPEAASARLYDYVMSDDQVAREALHELATALVDAGESGRGARVFERIWTIFHDRSALEKAAESNFAAGEYELAELQFEEAGLKDHPQYHQAKVERLLREGKVVKAAELLESIEAQERLVEIFELSESKPGKLSETDQTKLESKAAAAYFALRRFPEALDVYERLLSRDRLADVADLHLVYERIGDCLEKVGREQEAFAYYRRGRSYSKAVRLAEQLGLPRAEVLKLKIRGARDRKDFDSALRFAAETKNPRLVAEIRGQRNEHLGQHQAAVDDFIEAGRWSKAIRSIRLAKLAFTEEYAAKCKLLVAVALAEGVPKRSDKEQIMRVARQVQEDPVWERYVSPQEMGLVYEKCATRAEAAMYYKTKIPESDSSEG